MTQAIEPRTEVNELFRDPYLVTDLLVENMKQMGAEGVRYIEAQAGAAGFWDQDGQPIDVELTWEEIVQMSRNSLTFSFAEPAVKDRLLREYETAFSQFEKRYENATWRETLTTVKVRTSGYATRTFGLTLR